MSDTPPPTKPEDHPDQEMTDHGPDIIFLNVAEQSKPKRLDAVLAEALPEQSRSRWKALIQQGHVLRVDRDQQISLSDPALKLKGGENLQITLPEPEPAEPEPEAIPLNILFEDDDLIVLDKPAGLVVHPGAGHWSGTLVNGLLHHAKGSLSGIGGVARPGIVHRLDKDTSGVMVVAKTDRAHRGLAEQFADHGRTGPLERAYQALCWGVPSRPKITIETSIGRDPRDARRMAVRNDRSGNTDRGGRHAITHISVDGRFGSDGARAMASLVTCRLETGRTHQIRVHMTHIGHPVMGDPVYARHMQSKASKLSPDAQEALAALSRQALHAGLLAFAHPATGETMTFTTTLPEDMQRLINTLEAG